MGTPERLTRRLGTGDAILIGLGSMLYAGRRCLPRRGGRADRPVLRDLP